MTTGVAIHDPTAIPGSLIMRVTGASDFAGKSTTNAYSYWPSINSNSTRLILNVMGGTPQIYDFNPTTFTLGARQNLFATNPNGGSLSWEDAVWSATDPNILYAHDNVGSRLWAYNVSTRTYSLLKNFNTLNNSASNPTGTGTFIAQMSVSNNSDVFAFTVRNHPAGTENYPITGYAAWKASTNAMTVNAPIPSQGLDEVQIDKTGRYLVIKTNTSGTSSSIEVKVTDTQTNITTDLTDGAPDYSPGHSDNGHGIVVGADNWLNRITVRNLATPKVVNTVLSSGSDWSQSNHISMLANDESKALISFFTAGTFAQSKSFNDKIVFASLNGSQTVTELGYHYSVFNTPRTTDDNYYNSPRANISRDGRFITFTSNWNDSGRTDVYILALYSPGDANRDGTVNFNDFVILSQNFGKAGGWDKGDFSNNGTIEFNDFVMLSQNFGKGPGGSTFAATAEEEAAMARFAASAVTIPEPTTLCLLSIGAAGLLMRRRPRKVSR
jgi:hypothetical protein